MVGVLAEREEDPNIRGDAFKTLFVARLSFDTTEKDLEREFGRFGPIERVCRPGTKYSQQRFANNMTLRYESLRILQSRKRMRSLGRKRKIIGVMLLWFMSARKI